jgi:hypothetical protein
MVGKKRGMPRFSYLQFGTRSRIGPVRCGFTIGDTSREALSPAARHGTGAVIPARNRFAISQALSWVATQRSNPKKRLELQAQIADILELEQLKGGQPADADQPLFS